MGRPGSNLQYLKQMVRLLIGLGKQAQGEGSHRVMTPRFEECNKERLAILAMLALSTCNMGNAAHPGFEIPEPSSQIRQLRRGNEVVVEILNHYACKLNILVLG